METDFECRVAFSVRGHECNKVDESRKAVLHRQGRKYDSFPTSVRTSQAREPDSGATGPTETE